VPEFSEIIDPLLNPRVGIPAWLVLALVVAALTAGILVWRKRARGYSLSNAPTL
jgi:hypothetical protein